MSIQVNIAVQRNRIYVVRQLVAALEKQSVKPDAVVLILQGCELNIKSSLPITIIKNQSNKGAVERFKYLGKDINLIIDDDFVISKEYISTALKGLQRHPNAVCSFWGFDYLNQENYLNSWNDIECWDDYPKDMQCKRIGCGLSIFDESMVNLGQLNWEFDNYNDMQLAAYAANSDLQLWKIAHPKGIVNHNGTAYVQSNALWKAERHNIQFIQSQHHLIYESNNPLPQ